MSYSNCSLRPSTKLPPRAVFGLALLLASCGTVDPIEVSDGTVAQDQQVSFGDAKPLGAGVVTLAGSSTPGDRDGLRDAAKFNNPVNVILSPAGDVFVADFDNSKIRKVTPFGLVTTVLTGPSTFKRPFGLVFASDGTL